MADSKWCGTVNAMVFKTVKDANVPLKLLLISREYVNVVPRFGNKKLTFIRIAYLMPFKT